MSGLTAAGKTTHAKLLAKQLGVPYVAMLPLMTAVLRERHPGIDVQAAWTPKRDQVRDGDDEVDIEADRRMCSTIAAGPGVFDAWALPWLFEASDAIRVWIESDMPSRTRKCVVSALMRDERNSDDPADLVRRKDEFSRRRFRRLYGFELAPSPETFDIVLDNTDLIPEASIACAERGIAMFHPRLVRAIEQHLSA